MEKLTGISKITELPMPIKLMESCGEDGCGDICGEYSEKGCVGCPVQQCITEYHKYQEIGLSPKEIEDLKESEDYWHREAIKWAARMGESKIKFRELLNQFGIPEDNFKDDELEKFLYANRQQDKEIADEKRN